jgi:hypothetical protein
MTVEAQFLLTLLRETVGTIYDRSGSSSRAAAPASERVQAARAVPNLDWPALLGLADAHAVTPLLYAALRDAQTPRAITEQLRSRFENSARQSLAQSGELARLAGILDDHRIPFVAIKGPMLSHYLYGALGARSSGDIDVLVKPEDVSRIRKVLVPAGYRLRSTLHWDSDSALLRSRDKEISFESPSGVSIDVHWRLMPRYSASVFDQLTGWESLTTVPLAGRQIQTLAPEPLLLFLCAHGAKHMFERLGWICDIARFLCVTPNLDWARVTEQSRRASSLRQTLLGVHLAVRLLGSPHPEPQQNVEVERLGDLVLNRLMSGAAPPVPALESNRYTLRLLETTSQRLRYLIGLYLTPSEAEYRAIRIPPPLFFLYYPYRPIRLFWKHVV